LPPTVAKHCRNFQPWQITDLAGNAFNSISAFMAMMACANSAVTLDNDAFELIERDA